MSNTVDIAIIGAGPGGLGAATNAAEHGVSHLLIEKSEIGNTIYDYQLKKLVMAEPKKLPLRAHVEFEESSREDVLKNFNKALKDRNVVVKRGEAKEITKEGEHFKIDLGHESIIAKSVILAIGNMGTPRKLGVSGEDLPHIKYTLSDPDEYEGKHIAIVGAGDSAIENALALCERNTVSIINRRDEFPRAKDANRNKILDAIKRGAIRCFYNASVQECLEGELVINTDSGEVRTNNDIVIVRAGNIPPRKFVESCGVTFPNEDPTSFPVVSNSYESNVPGLYIVGALIGYPLIKQAINQGHEAVEHILGNPIEPADLPLIEEVLAPLGKSAKESLQLLRKKLRLLAPLSDPQFRELLIDSKVHVIEKGDTIFEKDDYGDSFWNVISGSVGVISPTDPDQLYRLAEGNFFGEMGLISGRRRAATIRAYENDTVLLETKRNQILKLMGSVTALKRSIDQVFFLRILKTSVFPSADAQVLAQIVQKAEPISLQKGEVLFSEGDAANDVFVILKGSVKVSKRNDAGYDVAQTYIAAGNYVGEMALVTDELRSATVTGAVKCELLRIGRDDFRELLQKNPETEREIVALVRERALQNMTSARNTYSGKVLDFALQQGISDADNVLLINSDLCIGCDNCEKACAATHDGYSRLDRKGGKSFAEIQVPISCRHCENPLCMLDCPPDALERKPNGEVLIKDNCIGCGNCITNCPYDVIQLVYESENESKSALEKLPLFGALFSNKGSAEKGNAKAAKCDMCAELDGGPACVRSCPTGAAIRVSPSEMMSLLLDKRDDR